MSTDINSEVLDVPQDIRPIDVDKVETSKKIKKWKPYEKVAFRIGFLYMLILCIPTYSKFYTHLFKLEFSKITYHDFQSIVAFWPPQVLRPAYFY